MGFPNNLWCTTIIHWCPQCYQTIQLFPFPAVLVYTNLSKLEKNERNGQRKPTTNQISPKMKETWIMIPHLCRKIQGWRAANKNGFCLWTVENNLPRSRGNLGPWIESQPNPTKPRHLKRVSTNWYHFLITTRQGTGHHWRYSPTQDWRE